jgi:hypothetical protein
MSNENTKQLTVVSEKPIYKKLIPNTQKFDYSTIEPIPNDASVSIISKEFVMYNSKDYGIYSTDDSQFLKGTLTSRNTISLEGYGGIVQYTVKLDNGNEIKFLSSPREYYFKIEENPEKKPEKKSVEKSEENLKQNSKEKSEENPKQKSVEKPKRNYRTWFGIFSGGRKTLRKRNIKKSRKNRKTLRRH